MFIRLIILFYLSIFTLICQGETDTNDLKKIIPPQEYWENSLKQLYFPDQNIFSDEQNEIVKLKAPYRAEDAAIVPISIQTTLPSDKNIFIKKIYIFIDKNPSPLTGVFEFNKPDNNRADLSMRVRVNEFTYIRAIAETSDGKLYMDKSFIKASGGCSIPTIGNNAAKNLGRMQTRIMGKLALHQPNLVQLKIKHPNYSGLESAAPGNKKPEQNYIKNIKVILNGEQILNADLTFSISTDPSFRFYITPEKEGLLEIKAIDTKNNIFTHSHLVDHNNVSTAIHLNH